MNDTRPGANRNKVSQHVYDQIIDNEKLKENVDAFLERHGEDMDYIIDWYFKDIRDGKGNGKHLSFDSWFQNYAL